MSLDNIDRQLSCTATLGREMMINEIKNTYWATLIVPSNLYQGFVLAS